MCVWGNGSSPFSRARSPRWGSSEPKDTPRAGRQLTGDSEGPVGDTARGSAPPLGCRPPLPRALPAGGR